jgi:hypothetical protein
MADAEKLSAFASRILKDLEWQSLLERYRGSSEFWGRPRPENRFYFFFDPLDYRNVANWRVLAAIADQLNADLSLVARFAELQEFGIEPKVTTYEESGFSALIVIVRFNKDGLNALEGLDSPMVPSGSSA